MPIPVSGRSGPEEFEYVIVGAGSAGCVLANRLTADPGSRVLLHEAGPPDDAPEIRVPAASPTLWRGAFAWDEYTVPQRHAADRRVFLPTGCGLGGSSSINATIYVRGNRLDYDTWRDQHGCTGWGYADLLPYFLRAEDQQRGASPFHGVGGPLRVEDLRHRHAVLRAWVDAATRSGVPGNSDFNGPEQLGVGFFQVTQRRGERWSTADAYLVPAMTRPNLTMRSGAVATRVVVGGGERAVGVRYSCEGVEREIRATREVVVSCGGVHTPKLLMTSGIGPADDLRELGIDVVLDSPRVGVGLQDHPVCAPQWYTPDAPSILEEATDENLGLWTRERRGPMASNGPEAGAFIRSDPTLAAPDIELAAAPGPGPEELSTDPGRRAVSLLVAAVDVRSRGRVILQQADATVKAAIDPGFLADEHDLDVLLAGVRIQREIAAQEPLAAHVGAEYAPGAEIDDDERLRAWIRRTVTTFFHPTSSCAMGAASDAVCDPMLRVRGVDGVRVVDASVMPAIIRGHTNAPTIAIAERAADLILGNTPLTASPPVDQAAPRT